MSSRTTAPTLWLPPSQYQANVVPGNAAWVYSGWQTKTTGLPYPVYITRLNIVPNNGGSVTDSHNQVQLATGASGSESIKLTHRSRMAGDQFGNKACQNLPFAYGPIPSGTRIAVRVAHSLTADVDPYHVGIGYQQILGGMSDVITLAQTVDPIDSGTLSLAGATWPTWGAWGELLSAAEVGTGGIWIKGILPGNQASSDAEYQLGFGAAAAEAPKTGPIPSDGTGSAVGPTFIRFPHALFVPASTRVAARCRSSSGAALTLHIWYAPRA